MTGLSQKEFDALSASRRQTLVTKARAELYKAGAHYVVDSVADVDPVLDDIDTRLKSAGAAYQPIHEHA